MTVNKNVRFLVDADEVVYWCIPALIDWFKTKYGVTYTVDDLAIWGPTNDFRDKRFEAFADPAFVLSQPLYEGAKEFIKELKKRGEVIFCTAVHSNCLTVRAAALQRDFGIAPENVITASRKDLVHADFLIDDSPYNIRHSSCDYPILFRRKGSEAVSGALSATKYEDILTFVDFVLNRKPTRRMASNTITCLVGPTGAGKTEMIKAAVDKGYKTIRAFSTRKSKKYEHINKADFDEKVRAGEFAEYTVYGGEYYGILVSDLDAIEPTDKVICAVDICGAMALKNIYGTRVALVFCDVSRMDCIKAILNRNLTQDEKAIRLANMESELSNERFCDFTVRGAEDFISSL